MGELNEMQRVAEGISDSSNEYWEDFLSLSLSERLDYIDRYAGDGMGINLSLGDIRMVDMYLRVCECGNQSQEDFAFLALGEA